MTTVESATKILDTMLGHLGFIATIEVHETDDGACLQIHSSDSEAIIGHEGDRLDDIQYLVNRILRRHSPTAERIKVDCEFFRSIQEDQLKEEVTRVAERVSVTGNPFQLRPLNAYYRRLVHHILAEDSRVTSHSPQGEERLKRITISAKPKPNATP